MSPRVNCVQWNSLFPPFPTIKQQLMLFQSVDLFIYLPFFIIIIINTCINISIMEVIQFVSQMMVWDMGIGQQYNVLY